MAWELLISGSLEQSQELYEELILVQTYNRNKCKELSDYYEDLSKRRDSNLILTCISSSDFLKKDYSELHMRIINWGHTYLVSGDINSAVEIYSLFQSDKVFKDYENKTVKDVIISDWDDFVKKDLISKETVKKTSKQLFP